MLLFYCSSYNRVKLNLNCEGVSPKYTISKTYGNKKFKPVLA